jgi:hypothetical protein
MQKRLPAPCRLTPRRGTCFHRKKLISARCRFSGGFKGIPEAQGIVEIGYSILSQQQRQGYATEAVLGWQRLITMHEASESEA